MLEQGQPLVLTEMEMPRPAAGEVLLEVAACGLCHTDVGFLYDGVRPNYGPPLTLGHEIVGRVVEAGAGCEEQLGKTLLVPAVLPCGDCDLCARGRGNACRKQKMPGNDFDGGFASHFVAPARFLCPVPDDLDEIEDLSVVADAVGTAYQAVARCELRDGDLAIVVGAGGVGTFAVQSAKVRGARVVAIDVDPRRLEALGDQVDLAFDASKLDLKSIRKEIKTFEKAQGVPPYGRRILECSGSAAGQETAYALLNHDARLAVVGFTMKKTELRLSNLMAFDATAFGNWGCLPEFFPEILEHVRAGRIDVKPYVERFPMSRLNELLKEEGHVRRPVLIPDFEA
jgi:6-hydroxycyclohex-1-ene-1-carbonyl-CoA dehydrogenase